MWRTKMSWGSKQGVWVKEYQGNRYRVRCASHQAAATVQSGAVETQVDTFVNSLTPPTSSPISKLKSDYLHKLLKANLLPENIDEAAIADHLRWLNQQPWSRYCKLNRLKIFKSFARWQAAQPKVDLAKLLNGLPVAPNNILLWALLCLNCGLTVAELGQLTWDQLDLAQGVLTRRSQRTGCSVPFRLWPETLEQLRSIRHRKGLVFLNPKTQTPMYETWSGGAKKDLFSSLWKRARPTTAIRLAEFRRIAATCLNDRLEYHHLVEVFLGHSPRQTIAALHGVTINQSLFEEALSYLRTSLLGVQVALSDAEIAQLEAREKLLVAWVQEAQDDDFPKAVEVYGKELAEVRSLIGTPMAAASDRLE